jgi:hypothetical protein
MDRTAADSPGERRRRSDPLFRHGRGSAAVPREPWRATESAPGAVSPFNGPQRAPCDGMDGFGGYDGSANRFARV